MICHGDWDGGRAWKDVAALLRAAAHEVYTGLGERNHLLSRDIDLNEHIQDILMVLEYEDLSEVILVGHSMAGVIITGVADNAHDRLCHLVFLDAFVAEDGQSIADMYGPEAYKSFYADYAEDEGDGWPLPYKTPDADR